MEVDETLPAFNDGVSKETAVKHIAPAQVQLKEDDPFDLDQYIGQYAGKTSIKQIVTAPEKTC